MRCVDDKALVAQSIPFERKGRMECGSFFADSPTIIHE